jgi:uncharacterized membrane protein YebE (DUF533 family)
MIDPNRLLDQFLGGGSQREGNTRDGGRSGGIGDLLGGGQQGGGLGGMLGGGQGGGIGDMLGGLNQRARDNPLASGALAGGLAAILLGSKAGRKLTKNAVAYGGMAVIGGLAYKAYQDYQARRSGQVPQPLPENQPELLPPPKDTPFMPKPAEADNRARLLVTAMISAAKADGYIDQAEQDRIFERLDQSSLDTESKAYVMDQLRAPLDLDAIVRSASQPEVATEVYAASLLAIDPDHPAEKAYLQMLAARLGLDDALVQEIHRTAANAGVKVEASPA